MHTAIQKEEEEYTCHTALRKKKNRISIRKSPPPPFDAYIGSNYQKAYPITTGKSNSELKWKETRTWNATTQR